MHEKRSTADQTNQWLHYWMQQLVIKHPVRLERASIWSVTDRNGRRGCSLVGVVVDTEGARIIHTRRLTEEDIVHELLHVAHPHWSEEAVVAETARLLKPRPRHRRAARSTETENTPARVEC